VSGYSFAIELFGKMHYNTYMTSIKWLGQACIVITYQQKGADQASSLVMDPYEKEIGFTLPKLEANAVTVSHDHFDHNNASAVSGKPFIINEPGEYEVAGFSVQTVGSFHDSQQGAKRGGNLIMKVDTPEFSFAHFGDFGQDELTSQQRQALGGVDIVFMPIGGFFTVDGAQAAKIVSQLEPRVVVPIHYQIPGLTIKELVGPERFIEAIGVKPSKIEGTWKVKAQDLPSEGTHIIELTAQTKK
jgi:L-ascorbate metabolism protein UlaG (beta-lactamase superfamily)